MATKYVRNGRWHIQYSEDGKLHQFSTKIKAGTKEAESLADATLKEIEAKLARDRIGLGEERKDAPIMEAAKRWFASVKSSTAPRTAERYLENINALLEWWKEHQPKKELVSQFDPASLQDFITHRSSLVKPNTVRGEISHLGAFFNWCIRMGYLIRNPLGLCNKPKRTAAHIRWFSVEEAKRIFAAAPLPRRDLYLFLYRTGCRIGETSRLLVKDIDFKRNVIRVPADITKARRPDEIEIHKKIRPVLTRLCAGKKPETLLFSDAPQWGARFNNIRKEFQSFLANMKPPIPNASLHTWRHTAISHWVQDGVHLAVVQVLARHEDIKTTMRYAHLGPDQIKGQINRQPI